MIKQDCILYVDLKINISDILNFVHEKYGGVKSIYYIDCDWAVLDIEENDEYSWIKKRRKDDGFLYFRYKIAIESKLPEESLSTFINNISAFIKVLKEKGAKVVPACDFEEELKKI
jgi:hypothetical protein